RRPPATGGATRQDRRRSGARRRAQPAVRGDGRRDRGSCRELALGGTRGDRPQRPRGARAPARHRHRPAGGKRPAPRVTSVHDERLAAQLLAGPPARDPVAVAERLLAIQAQDPRGARLAVRARSEGLSAADVDRALGDRSLVISWLNRGTLHLVRSEDYWWLHALTTPPLHA